MTQNANTNPPAPGQTPPGGDQSGQTPPPTQGQTPPAPQQQTSLDQLPADIQDYIKRLRKEAEAANEKAKADARAKAAAEEARLKEQGEYKALAEKHEARVHELEPTATRFTALAEQVNAAIEAEVKDWPAEVKTFDPGKDAPIESRLEWRNKSRPLIDKLQTTARGTLPGNRPNPTPQGEKSFEDRVAANYAELAKKRGTKFL